MLTQIGNKFKIMDEYRTVKAYKLIDEAIRSLRARRGCTPKEIIKFVSANRGIDGQTVKCIRATLWRGVVQGVLRANKGRYSICVTPTSRRLGLKKPRGRGVRMAKRGRRARRAGPRRRSKRSRGGRKRPCPCLSADRSRRPNRYPLRLHKRRTYRNTKRRTRRSRIRSRRA